MSHTIRVVFTRRKRNIGSWLIRWALPRSRFSLALSSHALIVDGDYYIEAHMRYGVRRSKDGLTGLDIVKAVNFWVPDAELGIAWARNQVGKKYDWPGAFGLALDPGRDWQDPDSWFCYELAAGVIVNSGRDAFASKGHITETTLFSIKP
jgi:hypothetical protein